jgi:hypothetical protein
MKSDAQHEKWRIRKVEVEKERRSGATGQEITHTNEAQSLYHPISLLCPVLPLPEI